MKKLLFLLGIAVSLTGCSFLHKNKDKEIDVDLSAREEVPVNTSAAKGVFYLNVDKRHWYSTYTPNTNDSTHNPRAAHFHCAKTGVNGPVVYLLAAGDTSWVKHRDYYLVNGKVEDSKFSPNQANSTCPIVVNSYERLIQAIKEGYIYVNIHTQAYPGGEIRGQVRY